MSRDEQRVNGVELKPLTDRSARHRLNPFVELSRCAAIVFERFGVDYHAASLREPTIMAVYENQFFIHQQSQPSAAQRSSAYL